MTTTSPSGLFDQNTSRSGLNSTNSAVGNTNTRTEPSNPNALSPNGFAAPGAGTGGAAASGAMGTTNGANGFASPNASSQFDNSMENGINARATGRSAFDTRGVAGQNTLNGGQFNGRQFNGGQLNGGQSTNGVGNRMTYYNGQWWYYTPNNTWMYYRNNSWTPYSADQYRPYTSGYRGTAGANQSRYYTDENGQRYRRDYTPDSSSFSTMSGQTSSNQAAQGPVSPSQASMAQPMGQSSNGATNEQTASPERNANVGQGNSSR